MTLNFAGPVSDFDRAAALRGLCENPLYATTALAIRDAVDLKRLMIMVWVALWPAAIWGMYNTGYQANIVGADLGALDDWRISLLQLLGVTVGSEAGIIGNL